MENGADVRNRGHLQVPCGPVFPGADPSEGEEDTQPDQIYGCDGAAPSRGDRPESGIEAFRRNVFGFGALEYVQKSFSVGFFSGINLMAAVAAFVLVWAYQKKAENQGELASWAVFFCVAVSFSIFGFSTWNPQWILLMAPFLVLNILINGNGNLLLMITNIFMLAMYIFSSQSMVDERVLNGGILKYILKDREFAVRMWDLYRFHDQELLCTAMWIVLVTLR